MTLDEIIYQMDGSLRTDTGGNIVKISLFDNVGDVAVVVSGEVPNADAVARGESLEKARQNLVNLLRGKVLLHYWLVMGDVQISSLRIPPTLTV